MPMRRGDANPRDPWRGPVPPGEGWEGIAPFDDDAAADYAPPSASGRRPGYGPRSGSRYRAPEPESPVAPPLTLPSVPRMPRPPTPNEQSRDTTGRVPIYDDPTPYREPSVLVPGRDSGKLAAARQSGRIPSVRDPRRASAPGYPRPDASDDWDAAERWQAVQSWDEVARPTTQRAPVPALAAYQRQAEPVGRVGRVGRVGTATQALAKRARSRWWTARYLLAAVAAICALFTTFTASGQPADAHQTFQASASSKRLEIVAQQVKPITSLLHPEQYDSKTQFDLYSGAACSPTTLAEVLTAWGVPDATIGHMIDDLGPKYLDPNWGLLDQQGFEVAAAKHNMRADISWTMTYDQMLYLTNVLGIPVIVNFHRSWGYYSFFAGGHFLVVTGGDQNGVNIVDSSEYYIKYLPRDTFDGLWFWKGDGTAMTVVIVPESYQYTLPKS